MRGIIYFLVICIVSLVTGRIVDKRKCPEVRAVAHFDLSQVGHFSLLVPPNIKKMYESHTHIYFFVLGWLEIH